MQIDHYKHTYSKASDAQLLMMLQERNITLQLVGDVDYSKEQIRSIENTLKERGVMVHPYHCPECGLQLVEERLGMLKCLKCLTGFLPTMTSDEKRAQLEWSPLT